MRTPALGVALVLAVATMSAGAMPAAAAPTLSGRLDALVGGFPGGTAIWIGDPSAAQPLYTKNADTQVIAASLWKLAVLAEVERRVDLGQLRYDDTIVIEPEDVTEDGSFEAPGTELTVDEALERMITISDNGTAMAFWRILGAGSINTLLSKSGIAGFHVAADTSEDNIVTARAVGTYFTKLAKGQLVSKTASARMLTRLERQQINDRIPAQLPEGTRVAHKTGDLAGLVHDAGIVITPRSQRVVVAMTWDTDDDPATELISHVAGAVYSEAITPPASSGTSPTQRSTRSGGSGRAKAAGGASRASSTTTQAAGFSKAGSVAPATRQIKTPAPRR
ncbi:MAG: serine hydrolase, partial [Chloroflexi bacterium]|nr:serine hydrolase [Chloroflexota bacterium]